MPTRRSVYCRVRATSSVTPVRCDRRFRSSVERGRTTACRAESSATRRARPKSRESSRVIRARRRSPRPDRRFRTGLETTPRALRALRAVGVTPRENILEPGRSLVVTPDTRRSDGTERADRRDPRRELPCRRGDRGACERRSANTPRFRRSLRAVSAPSVRSQRRGSDRTYPLSQASVTALCCARVVGRERVFVAHTGYSDLMHIYVVVRRNMRISVDVLPVEPSSTGGVSRSHPQYER